MSGSNALRMRSVNGFHSSMSVGSITGILVVLSALVLVSVGVLGVTQVPDFYAASSANSFCLTVSPSLPPCCFPCLSLSH